MRSAVMAGKVVLAIALLAIMAHADIIDIHPLAGMWNHKLFLLLGVICLFGGLVIGAARWGILLRTAGVQVEIMTVFRIQLIGSLLSTFLPGSAGGDAARATYLYMALPSGRTLGLMALAVDRLFSLFGLVALTGILLIADIQDISLHPVLGLYARLSAVSLAVMAPAIGVLYAMALRFRMPVQGIKWIEYLRPYGRQVRKAVLLYGQHWLSMVVCAILSIAGSFIVVTGIVIIARAFDFSPGTWVTALAGTLGNISSAIPLTPGGIGIGEAVFAKVCADMAGRAAPYASIYLAFRMVMALVSLSGVYAFLSFQPARHRIDIQPQS